MLTNEWVSLRSRVCLLSLKVRLQRTQVGFVFGVKAQTEMKTGMCMLKVVLSETSLGVEGLKRPNQAQYDKVCRNSPDNFNHQLVQD